METEYILEYTSIFSLDRDKLLFTIRKDPNWLQSYILLLSSTQNKTNTNTRYLPSLQRYEWMNNEIMNKDSPLIFSDPQSGKEFEQPPIPTFVIIKKSPAWNSILNAAAKEIQTRLRFTRTKLESYTKPISVGVVGIANSKKDAEEQMDSVFGNESLGKFVDYKIVYTEADKYVFRLDWKPFPDKLFKGGGGGGGGFANIVEETTPEGKKRSEAKKAFQYMIQTNILYSTKSDPLPNDPVLIKHFAKEYLDILQQPEIERTGIFTFNYKRHLRRYPLWISIDTIYFRTSLTNRLQILQDEKNLDENIAFVTWYSLLDSDEVNRLRKRLTDILSSKKKK